MTENSDQPDITRKRSRVGCTLIGIIFCLIFYVASAPWVFHLIHFHFGQPAPGGLEHVVTIYCYPVKLLMKLFPLFRSLYIPYWQWAFRIVARYLR